MIDHFHYCPYAQKAIGREIGHWYQHGAKPPTFCSSDQLKDFFEFYRIDHYNKHRWLFCFSSYWKAMWSCCCCHSSQINLFVWTHNKKFRAKTKFWQVSIWLYVIIMSHTSFSMNLHSIVCLNVKELFAQSRRHILSLSDSNRIWTHNHLVCKQTLNHLAKLAKLRTKWLWVRIPLLSLKSSICFKRVFKYPRNVAIVMFGRSQSCWIPLLNGTKMMFSTSDKTKLKFVEIFCENFNLTGTSILSPTLSSGTNLNVLQWWLSW